jgi:FlaA1/EpsC-like NDP-sugar epimerase
MLNWAKARTRLPRVAAKHLAVDIAVMVISLFGAIYLRVGPTQFEYYAETLGPYFFGIVAIKLATMVAFRCYAVMWRYISSIDAVRLAEAIFLSTALSLAISFFIRGNLFLMPRSIFIIDALLALVGLLGVRMARRLVHEGANRNGDRNAGKRTLIYGAGQNGRHLAQRLKLDSTLMTQLVGFIDDDPAKQKLVIHGLPVIGTSNNLEIIISEKRISEIIVAIPHLSGDALKNLILTTKKFNIRPRIITKVTNPSSRSTDKVEVIREINLADLLNHPPREIDLKSVRDLIHGKCVLVTGAGGSIGSEIARQALQHEPGRLLLLDHSEFNLYAIDSELRIPTSDHQRVVPLLVDIKNSTLVDRIIHQYSPDVIFHAAAYKHVHLVEANLESAVLNNIGGTLNLLKSAKSVGVKHFVNISTDKAVNPAGAMGATKRICELLVTAYSKATGGRYCSVRFGNVLGSSGSLIPLLKEQIKNGGPITLTHPEMTRFFMLIPEAVALVLKASTISKPGDISILKMGEPMPIVEVARSLLALMGKSEQDINIVFTGVRPGEKLYEELYIRGDELETEHPDVLTLPNGDIPDTAKQIDSVKDVPKVAEELLGLAALGSPETRTLLNKTVKAFQSADLKPPAASQSVKLAKGLTRTH